MEAVLVLEEVVEAVSVLEEVVEVVLVLEEAAEAVLVLEVAAAAAAAEATALEAEEDLDWGVAVVVSELDLEEAVVSALQVALATEVVAAAV